MEHTRTELRLESNARLLGAVAPVILHAAQRVGLMPPVCEAFEHATEDICRQTLNLMNGRDPFLHVTVEDFDDRIEVTIEHSGRPYDSSLMERMRPCSAPAGSSGADVPEGCQVDDIRCQSEGGHYRVRLVKFVSGSHKQ
jgi:hypothetical protein